MIAFCLRPAIAFQAVEKTPDEMGEPSYAKRSFATAQSISPRKYPIVYQKVEDVLSKM